MKSIMLKNETTVEMLLSYFIVREQCITYHKIAKFYLTNVLISAPVPTPPTSVRSTETPGSEHGTTVRANVPSDATGQSEAGSSIKQSPRTGGELGKSRQVQKFSKIFGHIKKLNYSFIYSRKWAQRIETEWQILWNLIRMLLKYALMQSHLGEADKVKKKKCVFPVS